MRNKKLKRAEKVSRFDNYINIINLIKLNVEAAVKLKGKSIWAEGMRWEKF